MEITLFRQNVDDLDAAIARLIKQRAEVSSRIAERKKNLCLPRVDLSRETEVIENYTDRLGPTARSIAILILSYSKGQ